MPSILFVCTGNRARSPFAAACFRRELAKRGLENDWHVSSAGTWASDGLPALPGAQQAARQLGMDLSDHKSTAITAAAISGADIVVVMEQGQKEALSIEFPASSRKLHLLSEVATGVAYSLPDPDLSPAGREVFAEAAELVRTGFDSLLALALG